MTLEQALKVLIAATANLQATREQHAQITAALNVIGELLKKPQE
jgi:hypothetical protein